jgi:hypothetical protein
VGAFDEKKSKKSRESVHLTCPGGVSTYSVQKVTATPTHIESDADHNSWAFKFYSPGVVVSASPARYRTEF